MNSIIQRDKRCYVSGSEYGLDSHHIFKGSRRKASENYGLKVWLRHDIHLDMHDHRKPYETLENELKVIGQQAFEDNGGTREEFMSIFGANYLD